METKTCSKCGRELPADRFGKQRNICKDCSNEQKRAWRKKRGDKLEKEIGYRLPEKERERINKECTRARIKAKYETGKTYRSEKEANRQREYSRRHIKKTEDLTPEQYEKRKKSGRRYWERKKLKEFVNDLDGFNFDDLCTI